MNLDNFIECEFDCVSIASNAEGDSVLISILDHKKNRWNLTASVVHYFVLNGMCLQNIIETISIFDACNVDKDPKNIYEKIFFLLQGRYPDSSDRLILKEVIEKILQDIRLTKCLLLEIRPVYGAYILLIANRVSIHQK